MQSEGEYRVAGDRHVSVSQVDQMVKVNRLTAELIDLLQDIKDLGLEAGRCAAIAMTKFEEAAMWANKAITKPRKNEGK